MDEEEEEEAESVVVDEDEDEDEDEHAALDATTALFFLGSLPRLFLQQCCSESDCDCDCDCEPSSSCCCSCSSICCCCWSSSFGSTCATLLASLEPWLASAEEATLVAMLMLMLGIKMGMGWDGMGWEG